MNLLVDVLRGSARREVLERGLHRIKTYGAGRDYSVREWSQYITQMINQGLLEIDYVGHSVLRCTPLSDAVLFEGRPVTLHRPGPLAEVSARPPVRKKDRFEADLVARLGEFAFNAAKSAGRSAQHILPAQVVSQLAASRPLTVSALAGIPGLPEITRRDHGEAICALIRGYIAGQKHLAKPKGVTYITTLQLFREGLSPEAIAERRKMAVTTIAGHLARWCDLGEDLDISRFVKAQDLEIVRRAWLASGRPDEIGRLKAQVGEQVDYATLQLAMAIIKRETR
jgi:ATP-dependent DNA helicase RecQ